MEQASSSKKDKKEKKSKKDKKVKKSSKSKSGKSSSSNVEATKSIPDVTNTVDAPVVKENDAMMEGIVISKQTPSKEENANTETKRVVDEVSQQVVERVQEKPKVDDTAKVEKLEKKEKKKKKSSKSKSSKSDTKRTSKTADSKTDVDQVTQPPQNSEPISIEEKPEEQTLAPNKEKKNEESTDDKTEDPIVEVPLPVNNEHASDVKSESATDEPVDTQPIETKNSESEPTEEQPTIEEPVNVTVTPVEDNAPAEVESKQPENPVEDKKDDYPTLNLPAPLQTLTKNRAQSVNARKRLSTKVPASTAPVDTCNSAEDKASVLFQYLVAASKKEENLPVSKPTDFPVLDLNVDTESDPNGAEGSDVTQVEETKQKEPNNEEKKPVGGGVSLPGLGYGNLVTADLLKNKLSARVSSEEKAQEVETEPVKEEIKMSETVAKASVGLRKVQPKEEPPKPQEPEIKVQLRKTTATTTEPVATAPKAENKDWMKTLVKQKSIEKSLESQINNSHIMETTRAAEPVAPDSPGGPDTSGAVYDAMRQSGSLRSDGSYVPSYIRSGSFSKTPVKMNIKKEELPKEPEKPAPSTPSKPGAYLQRGGSFVGYGLNKPVISTPTKPVAAPSVSETPLEIVSFYSYEQLKTKPPADCDRSRLELYLSAEDFVKVMGVTKEEFAKQPKWKQTNKKKEVGLF